MDAWALIRELDVLPLGAVFVAGAASLALVQRIVLACRRMIARRRAARAHWIAPADPREFRMELEGLRAACDVSAANLEAGVARLKQRVLERVRAVDRTTSELRHLRREAAEKSTLADALRQATAELELCRQEHRLQLQRHDAELRARDNALATAERTIAILRGALDPAGRTPPVPSRAAG